MKKAIFLAAILLVGISCYSTASFSVSRCMYYDFHYDTTSGKMNFIHNIRTNNFEHPRLFYINSSHPDEKNIPADQVTGFRLTITDIKDDLATVCFYGVHGEVLYDDAGNMTCPKLVPSAPDKDGSCRFSLPSS